MALDKGKYEEVKISWAWRNLVYLEAGLASMGRVYSDYWLGCSGPWSTDGHTYLYLT